MLKNSYIFIPVESTVRELDYKVNLARFFCNKGLNVIIGNPPFLRDELKYKNYRAIFLEKGLNPDPTYYKYLSNKGIYLYDLGDEGASEPVYSINYEPCVESLKTMRKIFLWGEGQRKDLIEKNPNNALSLKYQVVGNPGFDLCDLKYRKFNKALRPKSVPDSYILVNTNFGCFQSYSFEEHLKACNLISPSSKKMIYDGFLKEEKQFEFFQKWLESIIQSFPDEVFLIRPHPSEILENYTRIFSKYSNVIISKEGNVNYVIASSKMVLHKDCSTAMQAYLMGIPAVSLGGDLLYKEYIQWPLCFSALPKNIKDAKSMIDLVLNQEKFSDALTLEIDKKAKSILEVYFYNLGNSSKVLVDVIMQDASELLRKKTSYELTDNRSAIQKLKLLLRKKMPLHYKVAKAARETLVEFTREDIIKRLDLLESIDPLYFHYHVEKIFPNAFEISVK